MNGLAILLVVLISGALTVLFFFPPGGYPFYPRCQFHALTGLHCPGCGSLRAMHELIHGHWVNAFRLNPLLVSALPFLAFAGLRTLGCRWRGRQRTSTPIRPIWLWLGAGIVLAFGVLRNLPIPPFDVFAP